MKHLLFWILLLCTFGQAALEKILGGSVPSWFLEQFGSTILNPFPGSLTAAYYTIMLMELSTFLLIAAGLLKREFQKEEKRFLYFGAQFAQCTFIMLGFGQRLTHKYDAAAQLFVYAAITYIGAQFALRGSNANKNTEQTGYAD